MLLMKLSTKVIQIYLRQLSVIPKKIQFKYGIKKRRNVMKEIIGEAKHSKKSNFPLKLKIGSKIKTVENEITNEFNKYFSF